MARPSRNGKRGRKKGVTETQHMKCECKISTTHEIMEDGQLSAPNWRKRKVGFLITHPFIYPRLVPHATHAS